MSENVTNLVKDTCIDSRSSVKSDQPKENHIYIVIKLLKTKGEKTSWKQKFWSWGFTQEEWKHVCTKAYAPMFIAALSIIVKNWEKTQMSFN